MLNSRCCGKNLLSWHKVNLVCETIISHTRTAWLKGSGVVTLLLAGYRVCRSSRFRSSISTAASVGSMCVTKCLYADFVFASSYWEAALVQGPVSTWIHLQLLSLLQHCRHAAVTTLRIWLASHIFKSTCYRTLSQIKTELIRGFCSDVNEQSINLL